MKPSLLLPLLIIIAALTSAVINQQAGQSVYLQQQQQLGQALSQQLALSARPWLLADDKLGLQALLAGLVNNSQLQYVAIYAPDNQLLAAAGQPNRDAQQSYSADIALQNSLLGQAKVWLKAPQHVNKNWLIVLSFIPALLMAFAVYLWLKQRFDAPLVQIKHQLDRLIEIENDASPAQLQQQLQQFMQRWQSSSFWRAKVAEFQRKNPPASATLLVLVLHDEQHWYGRADITRVQQSKAYYQQLLSLASLHLGGGLPETYTPLTASFASDNDNQINAVRCGYLLLQLCQYLYRLLATNNRPAFQVSVGLAQPQNDGFRDAHSQYNFTLNEALSLGRYGQTNEILFNNEIALASHGEQESAQVSNELNNSSFHVLQHLPEASDIKQTAAKLWADLALEIPKD